MLDSLALNDCDTVTRFIHGLSNSTQPAPLSGCSEVTARFPGALIHGFPVETGGTTRMCNSSPCRRKLYRETESVPPSAKRNEPSGENFNIRTVEKGLSISNSILSPSR